MRFVNMFSTGITSWAAGKKIACEVGPENVTHLFCNTRIEDEDNYRFMVEAMANLGGQWVVIEDGRTPWEVFFDERFLGNSRVDPCSKILKRELADKWLREHCDPADTTLVIGYEVGEMDRLQKFQKRMAQAGWIVRAPLCEKPGMTKADAKDWAIEQGLMLPRLYDMGFDHANCGGFCVKAGKRHFKRLLEVMPARYREHEEKEQELRKHLGKDVSILTDRRHGRKIPLTLAGSGSESRPGRYSPTTKKTPRLGAAVSRMWMTRISLN